MAHQKKCKHDCGQVLSIETFLTLFQVTYASIHIQFMVVACRFGCYGNARSIKDVFDVFGTP